MGYKFTRYEIKDQILHAFLLADKLSEYQLILDKFGIDALNDFAWGISHYLSGQSTDFIIRLVKAFTLLQNKNSGFLGGSTSNIHNLLEELNRRDTYIAWKYRVWAFHTTNSPYVPFGTDTGIRAKTLTEYCWKLNARDKHNAEVNRLRSEQAKKSRAQAHRARIILHKTENLSRNVINIELDRLSPVHRLKIIAHDEIHSPYYFFENYADVNQNTINDLEYSDVERLIGKLSRAPKGNWRNLRNTLVNIRLGTYVKSPINTDWDKY